MAVKIFPTNKVFINMTALRHNFREVRRLAGERRIMAVVQADAYGHGLVGSAQTLAQAGADALGVTDVCDGLKLRDSGLTLPIHIMEGLTDPIQLEPAIRRDLSVFTGSPEQIRALSDKAAELGLTARVHLKIDTGLGQCGLARDKVEGFLREARTWPNLEIQGLATRLATVGDAGAREQLEKFDDLCYKANKLGLRTGGNSALDSAGLIWHPDQPSSLVRVGLMLYGVHPGADLGPTRPDLRPAMTVVSRVIHLRDLSPGETVGPGRAFVVRKPMRLAMVPFGCAQGLPGSCSGRGWALIRGLRAPRVGLVSLNLSAYDVTGIEEAAVGDNVVILGRHSTAWIRATDLASWGAVSPYEILTLLGQLNPRYVEGSDYDDQACATLDDDGAGPAATV